MRQSRIKTYVGVGGVFSLNEDCALAGWGDAAHTAL